MPFSFEGAPRATRRSFAHAITRRPGLAMVRPSVNVTGGAGGQVVIANEARGDGTPGSSAA